MHTFSLTILLICTSSLINCIFVQNKGSSTLIPLDQFAYDGIKLGTSVSNFAKKYPQALGQYQPINGASFMKFRTANNAPTFYIFLDGFLVSMVITYDEDELKDAGGIDGILDKLKLKYGDYKSNTSDDPKKDTEYNWTSSKGYLTVADYRGKKKKELDLASDTIKWVRRNSEVQITAAIAKKAEAALNRLGR